MPDTSYLHSPFFDDRHRVLAAELDAWTKDRGASEVQKVVIARKTLLAHASAGEQRARAQGKAARSAVGSL